MKCPSDIYRTGLYFSRPQNPLNLSLTYADNTLPDPKLRLGAANLPVDTFALDQEPYPRLAEPCESKGRPLPG